MRISQRARAILIIASISCFFSNCVSANTSVQNEPKPNILFIITDDQSANDLKIYDPTSQLDTPNLDRLSREGMVLDGAYHMGSFMSAVCVPSRHMIMSGRTVWHIPRSPEASIHCPLELEKQTLGAVFNRAGYDTMRTCKKGTSYRAANEEFAINKTSDGRNPAGSRWHADQVLDYLHDRDQAETKKPFLIYFGFSHPHDARNAKPDLLKKYGADNSKVPNLAHPDSPKLPVNYLPAHPFQFRVPDARDETRVQGVLGRRDESTIRNERGRYFACIEEIDIQIGRVLKKLTEMGEIENTYIFFTSDHGIAVGRHGLQGKQNLYQHSWRVPFIAKGPGIGKGTRAEGNVYLLDLLSTFCDLADINVPSTNEGISFRPVLEGKTQTTRNVMYGAFSGDSKPGIRCVKKGDWKLIKYEVLESEEPGGNRKRVRETQLFNLADNPDELLEQHHGPGVVALTGNMPDARQVNLAENLKYTDKLKEMESLLLSEQVRLDDPYRFTGQPSSKIGVDQTRFRELDKELKQLVTDGDIVGCQISFRQGDQALFSKGYGAVTQDSDQKVSHQTLFLIGSCSKPFASTCVLQLISDDDVDINLDSKIDRWIPAFGSTSLRNGEACRRAPTIAELMSHRAGIYSQKKGMTKAEANWIRNFSLTLDQSVEGIANCNIIAQPNEIYAYSGAGYCVLGKVAELATKQSIENLLQERLCKPLDLGRTTFFPATNFQTDEIATGCGPGVAPHLLGEEHRFPLIGGSLYSTADEMTLFGRAIAGQWHGDDNRIKITRQLIKQIGEVRSDESGYSLGWKVTSRMNEAPRLSHSGALYSYRAFLAVDLESRVSVAGCWTLPSNENVAIASKLKKVLDEF